MVPDPVEENEENPAVPLQMPAIKIYKSQKTKKDWDKKLMAMMKASSSMKLMKTP